MPSTKTTALILGLFFLLFLAGCGRALRVTPGGIAAGIVGEAIYDGLKSAAEEERARRAAWRAGMNHPECEGVVSTVTYSMWQPKPGRWWDDTGTTEPRRFR